MRALRAHCCTDRTDTRARVCLGHSALLSGSEVSIIRELHKSWHAHLENQRLAGTHKMGLVATAPLPVGGIPVLAGAAAGRGHQPQCLVPYPAQAFVCRMNGMCTIMKQPEWLCLAAAPAPVRRAAAAHWLSHLPATLAQTRAMSALPVYGEAATSCHPTSGPACELAATACCACSQLTVNRQHKPQVLRSGL